MLNFDELDGGAINAAYIQELYELYRSDPASVDEAWRRIFAAEDAADGVAAPDGDRPGAPAGPPDTGYQLAGTAYPDRRADDASIKAAKCAAELVEAYRLNGHYAADLDPLGNPRPGHPTLEPKFHGLTDEDMASGPSADLCGETIAWLRQVYTGTIGYEFEHLEYPERSEWIRDQIENGRHLRELSADEKRRLLRRLTEVEGLEQFLHKSYLGAKRFSVEGNDMLVPMLDLAIERAAQAGAREVVLGMAHRGRLNVLAHVLGRPYPMLIGEFEGRHAFSGGTGDVKYHLGAEGTYATASGDPLTVTLAPNPSHLEFVGAVVVGIARAKQSDRTQPELRRDNELVLPVLIHGDAAFIGQGVVPETFNLAELRGYTTGGSLHVIVNNQIGFTTLPSDARSTHYSSDLARGFDVPIFHVNADDPEACLAVVRLALAYREKFHGDVVIDLIGYRRYGHNEGDEPAYTQPRMYEAVAEHTRVRELWIEKLVADGVASKEDAQAEWDSVYQRLIDAQDEVQQEIQAESDEEKAPHTMPPVTEATPRPPVDSSVEPELLRDLDRQVHSWPDDFEPNPKLSRQLRKRAEAVPEGRPLDWAHAEALAFASLLAEGTPIRLTGQDTERGTFSQRHLVLHDTESGESWTPLAHLKQAGASFEIYNSPLSEMACVGFEYGYTTAAPETLVLWEAQFGDFVNGAQVIIDQFMSAGRAKWGQDSSLVLLLPHGFEGQGPEHSSARIERFLQLCAEDNFRVADCTTPAQYFHLLRRQAKLADRRPLIVFTPKSLLRNPRATSSFDELASGTFHPVLPDASMADSRGRVTRLVLCTGKVYYDLSASDARERNGHVAVARVEQLYPFPAQEIAALVADHPALEEVVWAQEEPRNMGAWPFAERRLRDAIGELPLRYVGRPERASPAEGFGDVHEAEQKRIVEEALAAGRSVGRP
ncbi:MAG TPA: 2-oxoglutarate dehydrogenase E1 component [Longimicrobiales bacterium]|nr:2-oxoglutarate dehydrogenase E1 component [Longimicrobiales bacterium]